MISDAAYSSISQEAGRRANSKAVLGAALRLYQENYIATRAANTALTRANIEALLLVPTSVVSLVDQSEIDFKSKARSALLPQLAGRTLGNAVWNVALNMIASVLFVSLSVTVYLSMQSTAQDFFQGLGFDVRPASERQISNSSASGESDKIGGPG